MAAAAPTQNPAFADAVQRARQITAKIGGTEKVGQKRPMEDGSGNEYSDPAKRAAVSDPFGAQLAAMKGGMGMGMGPVVSEEIRVPDKMVGLIIGRGGEQITRLQAESGAKIQMAPDSGGLPERVCTLTGSQEAISRGKALIDDIINSKTQNGSMGMGGGGMMGGMGSKPGFGMMSGVPSIELMIPASKVGLIIGKGGETIRNLSDKHGVKMLIVQESATQEGDKPLRIVGDPMRCEQAKDDVMAILDSAPGFGPSGGMARGRGPPGGFGDYGSPPGGGSLPNQVDIPVPQPAVGVIIGKGGEMIRKIQGDTGARLQFQQGKTMSPGEQVLTLSGKMEQVNEARRMVIDLIESVMARDQSMGRGRGGGAAGRGRGFGPPGGPWNGPPGDNSWGGPGDGQRDGGMTEILYAVPANKCGLVIGKGGENIKQINAQSGAHCELDKRPPQNPNEKLFYIRGMPDQIEHAKQLINEKIGGPPGHMGGPPGGSYGGGMPGGSSPHGGYPPQGWSGSGYSSWQGQSQGSGLPAESDKSSDPNAWASYYASYYNSGPQPGQPGSQAPQGPSSQPQAAGGAGQGAQDFSQQWIDYYRQMGDHEKAAAIEQSLKARAGTGGDPNQAGGQSSMSGGGASAGGDSAGKADYTAQWIAYYRANGMNKEADAIEQSLKARQSGAAAGSPYGTSGGQPYYAAPTAAYPGYPSQ